MKRPRSIHYAKTDTQRILNEVSQGKIATTCFGRAVPGSCRSDLRRDDGALRKPSFSGLIAATDKTR
jgi:hypothetical protein